MKKLGIIDVYGISAGIALRDRVIEKIVELQDEKTEIAVTVEVETLIEPAVKRSLENRWNAMGGFLMSKAFEMKNAKACDYIAVASNVFGQIDLAQELALQHFLYENDQTKNIWLTPQIIDINDSIINDIVAIGAEKILLLGPSYVMSSSLLRDRFRSVGIQLMDTFAYLDEVMEIDKIIRAAAVFEDLDDESVEFLVNFINQFPSDKDERPDAIVLGCQELSEIITEDFIFDGVPLIDGSQAYVKDLAKLIA